MATRIIKNAPKRYRATCRRCGTRFSYELTDVTRMQTDDYTFCPCCGCGVDHDARDSK